MSGRDAGSDPWRVDERAFPAGEGWPAQARFLIRYAVLAPSAHNAQPWLFHIWDEGLDLRADRSRALPVMDPQDRELTMGCGAALFHLRVAMRHFGLADEVAVLPRPDDPDLLARVRLRGSHVATPEDERLFRALPRRHTSRLVFTNDPIPVPVLGTLRDVSVVEGAEMQDFTDLAEKRGIAELVAEADRRQGADPAFRSELAAWIHPDRAHSRDGLPGYGFGRGDVVSSFGPLVVRTFDWGEGQAARDSQLAEGSPVLAVLGTRGDDPRAWLTAGQALDRLLLTACSENLSVSYLNQAVEVPELRQRLAALTPAVTCPQVVLRIGYGPPVPPTPRRPADEVILPE
jgi:hypothetical protein